MKIVEEAGPARALRAVTCWAHATTTKKPHHEKCCSTDIKARWQSFRPIYQTVADSYDASDLCQIRCLHSRCELLQSSLLMSDGSAEAESFFTLSSVEYDLNLPIKCSCSVFGLGAT